jgi:hypothetical protein
LPPKVGNIRTGSKPSNLHHNYEQKTQKEIMTKRGFEITIRPSRQGAKNIKTIATISNWKHKMTITTYPSSCTIHTCKKDTICEQKTQEA